MSPISVTMDVYAHVFPDLQSDAVSHMDSQDGVYNIDIWVNRREQFSRSLPNDQRDEAQRLAREWDAANPRD